MALETAQVVAALFNFYLLVCPCILSRHFGAAATSQSFFYNFSNPTTFSNDDLRFEGDAYAGERSLILARAELTGDNTTSSAGRVSYNQPVYLWSSANGVDVVRNFSTTFSFIISGSNRVSVAGGSPFFLAPYQSRMPLDSGGGYRGLFNSTTAAGRGDHIEAMEVDTHTGVGWGLNTVNFGRNIFKMVEHLVDGVPKIMQVDYSGITKALVVTLRDVANLNPVATLNTRVDLRRYLPQELAVGISAATGISQRGLHQVLWWSFNANPKEDGLSSLQRVRASYSETSSANNSSNLPPPIPGTPGCNATKSNRTLVVGCVVGAVLLVVTAAVVALLYCLRRRAMGPDSSHSAFNNSTLLRSSSPPLIRFSYKELLKATRNFSEKRILCEDTYRRELKYFSHVTLKILKIESGPAMEEYINILETRRKVRHRNIGVTMETIFTLSTVMWASAASMIISTIQRTLLTWPMRYKIALGIGSGLRYLHLEYDMSLIHGNIKSSNIMLDESFIAKLGVLEPLVYSEDEGSSSNAPTVPASRGYIDPEFSISRKASTASDVYSFGVVLLEMASGLPPIFPRQDQAATSTFLVDYIWELCEAGAVLDAADSRLNGEFDREEMERMLLVGLWCAHPDSGRRPSTGQAVDSLGSGDLVPSNLVLHQGPRMPKTTEEGRTHLQLNEPDTSA